MSEQPLREFRDHPGESRHRAALIFGVLDLLAAASYALLFFSVLRSRYPWFDAIVTIVCLALAAGGIGMLTRHRGGLITGAVGSAVLLLAGLGLIWGLLASAAYLNGIYGGFGRGASIVLLAAVALVFEVVCLLPTVQLWWLGRALQKRHGNRVPRALSGTPTAASEEVR